MTAFLPLGYAALLLAACLLPARADRFRGALGAPAYALGAASLPFLRDLRGPDPALWISAGLLLLGPAALVGATWRCRSRLGSGFMTVPAVALASFLALLAAWPLLRLGGLLPSLLSMGAIGLAAAFVYLAGTALGVGRPVRWLESRTPGALRGRDWWTLSVVALSLVLGVASLRWSLWLRLWQPVGIGAGALLAWCAVAVRRPSLALAGAGLAACFVAPDVAMWSWLGLGVAALLVQRAPWAAVVLAAGIGYVALPGFLDAEVLLSVILVGAATALLATLAREDEAVAAPR